MNATDALVERMRSEYEEAKRRFELRHEVGNARAEEELKKRLANFDLYVESVVDAKLIKVPACKTERKRNRILDDVQNIKAHYAKVRENMIKARKDKEYKKPLYLLEAEAQLAAALRRQEQEKAKTN